MIAGIVQWQRGTVLRIAGEHEDPRRFHVDHAWGPYGYDLTEIDVADGSFRLNFTAAHKLLVEVDG